MFSLLFGFISSGVIPISIAFVLWGTLGSLLSFYVNTLIVTYKPPKKTLSFTARYFLSTGLGEFLLVTIVTFGVFLPLKPWLDVVEIWLFSYATKVIFTILLAFPTKVLANFITKHYELP